MCRVDDIQLTTVVPPGLPPTDPNENGYYGRVRAWLNPDPAISSGASDCVGWSETVLGPALASPELNELDPPVRVELMGLTVDAKGRLVEDPCAAKNPVTCCALVP